MYIHRTVIRRQRVQKNFFKIKHDNLCRTHYKNLTQAVSNLCFKLNYVEMIPHIKNEVSENRARKNATNYVSVLIKILMNL